MNNKLIIDQDSIIRGPEVLDERESDESVLNF